MKLVLWSDSNDLYNSLHHTGKFEVERILDCRALEANEILLVDGNFVEYADFKTEFSKHNKENKIFFIMPLHMMQSNLETLKKEMQHVFFLPPRLTVNQTVEQVILSSYEAEEVYPKNLHLFLGADSKVGTTMIAQMNAELIAEYANKSVCLLLLGNNPVHYFDKKSDISGIDFMKIKLFNDILTKEDLLKSSIKTKFDNLTVITGPGNIQDRRYYSPEHAEKLLTLASQLYDVVIVDAGSEVERGLCIGAIRMVKSKFLVTTQQQNARDEFSRVADQVFTPLQIDKRHFFCVINKYISSGIQEKQVSSAYGMPVIGKVPNVETIGWQAEIEHKSLLHYNQPSFNDSVSEIASFIADVQGITFEKTQQRSFLKRWFG